MTKQYEINSNNKKNPLICKNGGVFLYNKRGGVYMKLLSKSMIMVLAIVTLLPSVASASIFKDVQEQAWYYPYLLSNQKQEIITGYEDGTFRPHESITRAQAAKIISKIIELPEVGDYKPAYKDVSSEHSAYNEIAALTKVGIFKDGEYFHPNKSLTRAHLSKIIVLMYEFTVEQDVELPFHDVPEDYWAKPYIAFLAKNGISTGVSKNSFAPTQAVTRAQMIVLLDKSAKFKEDPSVNNVLYDPFVKEYKTIKQGNDKFVLETIQLVNKEREKMGLPTLVEDPELNQIAFVKAQDMVMHNYFEHESPLYGAPWDMAEGFGYTYRTFGENIAHGYKNSSNVVTAWMNSEGHRANILNEKYTNIGVGIALDSNKNYYYVHMFSSN